MCQSASFRCLQMLWAAILIWTNTRGNIIDLDECSCQLLDLEEYPGHWIGWILVPTPWFDQGNILDLGECSKQLLGLNECSCQILNFDATFPHKRHWIQLFLIGFHLRYRCKVVCPPPHQATEPNYSSCQQQTLHHWGDCCWTYEGRLKPFKLVWNRYFRLECYVT